MARSRASQSLKYPAKPALIPPAFATGLDTEATANATSLESHQIIASYDYLLSKVFRTAVREYPAISVRTELKAGAPCISGTRIPVYMVLDAIQSYGSIEGARESYPTLTVEQIQQAVGFASYVVECPIDEQATAAA